MHLTGILKRRRWQAVGLAMLATGAMAAPTIAPSRAAATTVAKPWLIAMCKTKDRPTPPPAPTSTFFHDLFATPGRGLQSYFSDISYGAISLEGTTVTPWTQTPYTMADELRMSTGSVAAGSDRLYTNDFRSTDLGKLVLSGGANAFADGTRITGTGYDFATNRYFDQLSTAAKGPLTSAAITIRKDRFTMATDCIYSATSAGQDLSRFAGIAAIWDAQVGDLGSWGYDRNALSNRGDPSHRYGIVLADSPIWNLAERSISMCSGATANMCAQSFFEHEMLHGMGLGHSFDTEGQTIFDPAGHHCDDGAHFGEYCDPNDVMSNLWAHSQFATYDYSSTYSMLMGPGLNGQFLADLHWLPAGRTHNGTGTFDLTALGHTEQPGYLVGLVTVLSPSWVPRSYEVELREPDGWDRGVDGAQVNIHLAGTNTDNAPITTILSKSPGNKAFVAGDTYRDSSVTIHVNAISPRSYVSSLGFRMTDWHASVTVTAP